MNQDPNNDWLEEALRRDESYINDDGFAARVVAVLPPPRRLAILFAARVSWRPCAVIANGAADETTSSLPTNVF